jgi:uncharacterized protein YkwD
VRDPKRHRSRPGLEALEERGLMAGGLTASLSHGILTVVGKTTTDPITIDVVVARTKRGLQGTVVVEGLATYPAAQVKKIAVTCVVGEPLVVNRSRLWNPVIQVVKRAAPIVTPPIVTPPVVTPPVTPTMSAIEQAIVSLVNQARASNGLTGLNVSMKLVQAAQIHARDMANLNTMAHDLPGAQLPGLTDRAAYVGYNFWTLGENIAYGYSDAASVMNGWMNSPGHRSNILGASYTEIGVGVAYSASGVPYYCQVFGKPMA